MLLIVKCLALVCGFWGGKTGRFSLQRTAFCVLKHGILRSQTCRFALQKRPRCPAKRPLWCRKTAVLQIKEADFAF